MVEWEAGQPQGCSSTIMASLLHYHRSVSSSPTLITTLLAKRIKSNGHRQFCFSDERYRRTQIVLIEFKSKCVLQQDRQNPPEARSPSPPLPATTNLRSHCQKWCQLTGRNLPLQGWKAGGLQSWQLLWKRHQPLHGHCWAPQRGYSAQPPCSLSRCRCLYWPHSI